MLTKAEKHIVNESQDIRPAKSESSETYTFGLRNRISISRAYALLAAISAHTNSALLQKL